MGLKSKIMVYYTETHNLEYNDGTCGMLNFSRVTKGLEDVSKYPDLFAELIRRGFSDDDVKKISRLNLIRVLQDVEKISSELQGHFPDNTLISPQPNGTCRPDF